ncbi:response regulator [Cohnella lubricantis]|uniref:Response regulator n=1 Tax=Cohnella lubricantis TaxID=2163172 RepID=A0A841T6Z6_9BACL|nr:response regulator [Cohnella lubricantis]MBB6676662.1 response regulator [Cohnella lubricantis]MBP2120420.1 two-component system response regulator YesN [Cohnella lubricantis]
MYKVLLADDEPFALEGLELLVDWEKRGFRVAQVCRNGEEAIEHIRQDPPDLVVTDIRMPVLDGLELIEETRRLGNRSTLFVIASGYNDFDYARQAMCLGVKHYLTKPIIGDEVDEVLERLQKELHERERRQLIRDAADRYAVRQALSVLLFGSEEDERQDALRTLGRLSGQASYWTYMHVETDDEGSRAAREAALRIADGHGCCYLMEGSRGAFGLVVGLAQSTDEGMRAFAKRLLEAMRSNTAGRIEIAVGCGVGCLGDLSKSYSCAAEAERFLFYSGDAIVHYEDIQDKTLSLDVGALKDADAIVEAMEIGGPDDLAAAIRQAFRRFEERMTLPELIGIFATQAALRCASVYKYLGGDPDELLKRSSFFAVSEPGRHLQETAEALISFCLNCQSAVFELQGRQTGGTLAKVAEYLRHHYKESLTIKEIAERFYLHPVYLGQSFSRRYGRSILDYLHDRRIEEAKRLLRETEDASWAIAEALGYKGYQHFLKQFERRLGMKPSEYRQQASERRSSPSAAQPSEEP